jgi:hypothetical protein
MKINIKIFQAASDDIGGWFRIFGVGLSWRDIGAYGLLFSERNGYSRYLRIGKWIVKPVKSCVQ